MTRLGDQVSLTPKGWLAAARTLNAKANRARSARNTARRNVTNWSWSGDKAAEKRTVVERDARYTRYVTMAERALQRSNG
jgi:hypothetical protein